MIDLKFDRTLEAMDTENNTRVFLKVSLNRNDGCTPCFSMSAEVWNGCAPVNADTRRSERRLISTGQCQDKVLHCFPAFQRFAKFHLFGTADCLPMHYMANSLYRFGLTGRYSSPNWENFKNVSLYGEIAGDDESGIRELFEKHIAPLIPERKGSSDREAHDKWMAIAELNGMVFEQFRSTVETFLTARIPQLQKLFIYEMNLCNGILGDSND